MGLRAGVVSGCGRTRACPGIFSGYDPLEASRRGFTVGPAGFLWDGGAVSVDGNLPGAPDNGLPGDVTGVFAVFSPGEPADCFNTGIDDADVERIYLG